MHNMISVRSRLVFYYCLAALVLLLGVMVFLYWAMASEEALHLPWSTFISHERKVFFLAFVAGALITLPLAFLVTARGLRGLETLTRTVHDITTTSLNLRVDPDRFPRELRVLAAAFNQMLARIEHSFSRLKQLSDDMAHELRTPLTSLRVQTEVLLSGNKNPSEAEWREVLSASLEELNRMSAMTDNMLFLAQTERPQAVIEKLPLSVGEEISKICDYFDVVSGEKNIELSLAGTAWLDVNPLLFSRLMNNILSNALQYTQDGGWVRVTVASSPGQVSITVSDNGPGIAPEHLPKIFNRFYRADASRSENGSGTGLGLAIAKSITELHGGGDCHGKCPACGHNGKDGVSGGDVWQ